MKQLDIVAAVGLAGLYQGLFWKRVQTRWLQPATPHTR